MHHLLIFVGLVNLALGALVWCKNKKSPANILFFGFTFCIAVWLFGHAVDFYANYVDRSVFSPDFVFYTSKILLFFVSLAPPFIFLFTFYFPSRLKSAKKFIYPILAISLIFAVVSFFIPKSINYNYEVETRWTEKLLTFYAACFILLAVINIVRSYFRQTNKLLKAKIIYFLIGVFVASILGIVTNSVLPAFFKDYQFGYIGPLFTFLIVIFTAYSIVKYRFLDIKIVFRKSLIIALLIIIISLFILAAGLLASKIFVLGINFYTMVVLVITVALSLIIAAQLKQFFDKVFLKEFYDFSKKVERMKSEIRAADTLEKLSIRVVNKLKEVFNVKESCFLARSKDKTKYVSQYPKLGEVAFDKDDLMVRFIFDSQKPIVKEEIRFLIREMPQSKNELGRLEKVMGKLGWEIVFPLVFKGQSLGMLILGKGDSSGPHSGNMASLLADFNAELAHALQCVLDFEEWREKIN